jgi:phage minor structural protein
MGWDTRLAWSGEQPSSGKKLLQRFEAYTDNGATAALPDAAGGSDWTLQRWDAATVNLVRQSGQSAYVAYNPRMGRLMVFNRSNPATEATYLHVPYFAGMWPSSGRVLAGCWIAPRYSSVYNPVVSTRNDSARAPLMYMDFTSSAAVRHQVYGSDGSQIKNQAEATSQWPWTSPIGKWLFACQVVDLDNKTTQIGLVREDTHQAYVSPLRATNGTPNKACTADLDFLAIIDPANTSYYANGECDEAVLMHCAAGFDLAEFIEQVRLSTWARGSCYGEVGTALTVTDSGVTASASATLQTGAEAVAWAVQPTISLNEAITGTPTVQLSSDDGVTWTDYTSSAALPSSFTGLAKWQIPLASGESFTGADLAPPPPDAPTLDTPDGLDLDQFGSAQRTVTGTWTGTPVLTAGPVAGLTVTVQGLTVTVSATSAVGDFQVPLSLSDDSGEQDAQAMLAVTVSLLPAPTLDALAPVTLAQTGVATRQLTGSWVGTPLFSASAPGDLAVDVTGDVLTVEAGWAIDTFTVTVTVQDDTGQTGQTGLEVEVTGEPWTPPTRPKYQFVPPIVLDNTGSPVSPLPRVWDMKIIEEINGDHQVVFKIAADDERAALLNNEVKVLVAGETFALRVLDATDDGTPVLEVTGEAEWYDLARNPELPETVWNDTQPGAVLGFAVEGTGWHVGTVNVRTRRTWTSPKGNPLVVIQQVQRGHGGDLVFDTAARTVSLVTSRGQNKGMFFALGKNLREVRKRADTTQLATRLHAVTEDGETFANINDGKDYVDDFSWTSEVVDGYLTFAAGTNPYTMRAMTIASAGKYCKPRTTYEATVADLSAIGGLDLEALALGDEVRIHDAAIGVDVTHRVVRLERDPLEPWNTAVELSSTLRELGSSDSADTGVLTTGASVDTKDLVPFNLLLNARFDNGLAHWAASGAAVVEEGATGRHSVRFEGPGSHWVEQTCAPDNRDVYTFSAVIDQSGFPEGQNPDVTVEVEFVYTDGSTETVPLTLS